MPSENNAIFSLTAGEIETLKTVYGFVDPEAVLAGVACEEKDQLFNVVSCLRETPCVPTVTELLDDRSNREDIEYRKAQAVTRAEEYGIEALTPE